MFERNKKSTNTFEESNLALPSRTSPLSSAPNELDGCSTNSATFIPTNSGTDWQAKTDRRTLFGAVTSRDSVPYPKEYVDTDSRQPLNIQNPAYTSDEREEDQEIASLKQQIRAHKQNTLISSRNAVQKLKEIEESAANTMKMLGEQSSSIASVDRSLDLAKAHSDTASAQANELRQINRSMFAIHIKNPFNKSSQERNELEALQKDRAAHVEERNDIRQYEYSSKQRLDKAQRIAGRISEGTSSSRRSKVDRHIYQFEADEEDDALEDGYEQNIDFMSDSLGRLKNSALTMKEEVELQNERLDKINRKVEPLTERVATTTHKLNSIR
ncbi:hypothetical protein INT43_007166 [Umbelopsis isabellina]|uniref:t-SNARE coiled-coil homology domain-containing protein n=1 Tax=Mortierella isabellina TaxID=91625 RepID=A0A8H7PZE6_MORIS|nr:hypothetical protein INT43_007166 [Umbelopsis isabellina]